MDQLIYLDDRSDMADVRDLVEHTRRTASLAGVPPLLQHPPANDTQQLNSRKMSVNITLTVAMMLRTWMVHTIPP
jgi:hypothetical protein